MSKSISQRDLIMEFFYNNSLREISHPEIVDWLTTEYFKRTGNVFRDPDRGIRKLSQEGLLIKVKKGVYKYDPDFIVNKELEDFTAEQKRLIFERDGYKCVVCGRGPENGIEIQADHIKPKDLGGQATVENGQTLCAQHNFRKKNYGQTETGKKMFIRLYELAKAAGDAETQEFCAQILNVFEENGINGHIIWNK